MMGFGGGMPSPEEMAKLAEKMPGGAPGAQGVPPTMPGLPNFPGMPKGPGLPGLGGKLPTPGGLPPSFFGKKK
jgi:signal recognition particle subunit SRP54